METQRREMGFGLPRVKGIGPKAFGASLLLGAYLMLHKAAENQQLVVSATNRLTGGMLRTVVTAAITMVPMGLLIFGVQSVLVLRQKRDGGTPKFASAALVPRLSALDCEQLLGETYRLEGFSVIENRGHHTDAGVDLVLNRGTEKLYAQCRHWKDALVGPEIVMSLAASIRSGGATGGVIVSSGHFTAEAKAYAANCSVRLLDTSDMHRMMQCPSRNKA
jgi:restriction system protein